MAVDALSDDELLQLKKRARRRLVGAIALMLIALIVLRFVVESRPLPNDKPAPVAIDGLNAANPDQNQTTNAFSRPKTADVQASAGDAPTASVPASTQKADSEPIAPPVLVPAEKPIPELLSPAPKKNAESSGAKPIEKPKSSPVSAQAKKTEAVAEPARAKAEKQTPSNDQTEKDKSQSKPGRHVASVVALSDAAKAAELQRKLQSNGVKAFTEQVEVNGKTLTRVKIGPYESADALEKARAKLALMGL